MDRRTALILACLITLAACSGKQDGTTSAATQAPPPGTGPIKISSSNAFSPLVQDLNKAKAVNGQVQQQAKSADQSIEAQSAPAASTSQP